MKIEPRRYGRAIVLIVEFAVVTALCALWLLAFFGILYLIALAAVYW